MKYLKPEAVPVLIGDKEYKILFTLEIIYELQNKTELPMQRIIELVGNPRTRRIAIECIFKYMFNIAEVDDNLEYYSLKLINAYNEQSLIKDMPKVQASDGEIEFADIEYWVYYGTTVLGHPEEKVLQMTLGKIGTYYIQDLKHKKLIKEDREVSIDEAIPI